MTEYEIGEIVSDDAKTVRSFPPRTLNVLKGFSDGMYWRSRRAGDRSRPGEQDRRGAWIPARLFDNPEQSGGPL